MIDKICQKYGIKNYTINDDGLIDVVGNVNLYNQGLTELPLTFNNVSGWFDCGENFLTSLKGSPRWVGGEFYCGENRLTSLEFSPEYVGGYFNCKNNKLTDNYCIAEIMGNFFTTLDQDGLVLNEYGKSTNYNEWRKLYKRKLILNELYTRHM